MVKLLLKDEVYAVIGAAMEVYKATGYRVGLLINFGHPSELEWKRMVR
jgi:hypothetical protein